MEAALPSHGPAFVTAMCQLPPGALINGIYEAYRSGEVELSSIIPARRLHVTFKSRLTLVNTVQIVVNLK